MGKGCLFPRARLQTKTSHGERHGSTAVMSWFGATGALRRRALTSVRSPADRVELAQCA